MPIDGDRFTMLNARQKQCLRLFYANYGIKEIGAELGLSPNTVNEHLRSARRVLGTHRSMQAARLLFNHERPNIDVSTPNPIDRRREDEQPSPATIPAQPAIAARNRYNLGILTRIGLIIAIAFGAVALTGALLVGAEAITRIFTGYRIDISDPPYRQ